MQTSTKGWLIVPRSHHHTRKVTCVPLFFGGIVGVINVCLQFNVRLYVYSQNGNFANVLA